jgi:hypothetical protein
MQRFRKYIDKDLNTENVKNLGHLNAFGITGKHLPDPPEEFDEFEFSTDFSGQDIQIGVAVQMGKIKRIMLSLADKEDPDMVKGLTESQLKELLAEKGDQLIKFFEYITHSEV